MKPALCLTLAFLLLPGSLCAQTPTEKAIQTIACTTQEAVEQYIRLTFSTTERPPSEDILARIKAGGGDCVAGHIATVQWDNLQNEPPLWRFPIVQRYGGAGEARVLKVQVSWWGINGGSARIFRPPLERYMLYLHQFSSLERRS